MNEKKVDVVMMSPDPDVQAYIDLWVKLTPEEKLAAMNDAEKKMIRLVAGVDDGTAERLGF